MADFTVTRVYKVTIADTDLAMVPKESHAGLIDACTRQADIGESKPLYLYNAGSVDAFWGDVNDGDEEDASLWCVENWWAEEVDSDFD